MPKEKIIVIKFLLFPRLVPVHHFRHENPGLPKKITKIEMFSVKTKQNGRSTLTYCYPLHSLSSILSRKTWIALGDEQEQCDIDIGMSSLVSLYNDLSLLVILTSSPGFPMSPLRPGGPISP